MPTTTFTAWGQRTGEFVSLRVALASGLVLERTVTWDKVNTDAKLAAWVLAQLDPAGDEEIRRQLTVDFHAEERSTADGQMISSVLVVDGVTPAALPEDVEFNALLAGPLGTVTVAQAVAAIDAAGTLADVKAILRSMARLLIPLRNVVERVLALLKRGGVR